MGRVLSEGAPSWACAPPGHGPVGRGGKFGCGVGYLGPFASCFHWVLGGHSYLKNLQVPLLWLFFLYLFNVHINEYVLFIDVFGLRNIELEK